MKGNIEKMCLSLSAGLQILDVRNRGNHVRYEPFIYDLIDTDFNTDDIRVTIRND